MTDTPVSPMWDDPRYQIGYKQGLWSGRGYTRAQLEEMIERLNGKAFRFLQAGDWRSGYRYCGHVDALRKRCDYTPQDAQFGHRVPELDHLETA